jgi:predicted transcriptional regulator
VPPDVEDRLGDLARKRQMYVSDLIREAVEQFLARELDAAA